MFDILIKNGTVIDGTGQPMFRADIGIREDKIVQVGELHNEKGELEINATDKLVCPGFIDVNNHSDTYWRIFNDPNLESLVYQGITTIIGGNCGSSLAPLADSETIASIQKWSNIKQVNVNWLTMPDFLQAVSNSKLSVNFATLVGHGTLRRGILKDQMRAPDSKEMAFIEKMLSNALSAGALGMSSGLVYTHARTATKEELVALAKIIKKYGGVYTTHIRDEIDNFQEALKEAIEVARESKVKLHISHFKIIGEKNWSMMDEAMFLIGKAKEDGIDITFDVYPYTNTGTVLYTLLPAWVTDGGRKMMLSRLKDKSIRPRIIREMKDSGFDYSKVEIAISALDKTLDKRNITDIAKSQEKSIEDAVLDVLIASEGRVITSMEVLSQGNVNQAVAHPLSIIATNGAGYNLEHGKTGEQVHPRSFGTFVKILSKYVIGEKIINWEEAIMKMTSFPASKFGIKRRGVIKKDYFADIVVMNRDELKDFATVDNPYQYSRGMDFVLVNGKIVLSEGKYLGVRNGEVLKK
ncbi:MAG: D-aminoacylase [Parcubacteria group bacterium]